MKLTSTFILTIFFTVATSKSTNLLRAKDAETHERMLAARRLQSGTTAGGSCRTMNTIPSEVRINANAECDDITNCCDTPDTCPCRLMAGALQCDNNNDFVGVFEKLCRHDETFRRECVSPPEDTLDLCKGGCNDQCRYFEAGGFAGCDFGENFIEFPRVCQGIIPTRTDEVECVTLNGIADTIGVEPIFDALSECWSNVGEYCPYADADGNNSFGTCRFVLEQSLRCDYGDKLAGTFPKICLPID